jgi:hypothetical protein
VPTEVRIDQDWKALAELDEQARLGQMTERYRSLIAMGEADRLEHLGGMIRAEYELADAPLREFTHSRLRSWIELAGEDREGTRNLGRGYDEVFATLPAQQAMRRASIVQTVVSGHMTLADTETLFDVIPGLARQVPRQALAVASKAKAPAEATPVAAQRPFWARLFSFGRGSAATR